VILTDDMIIEDLLDLSGFDQPEGRFGPQA
jgi:hypothetical protein